MEHRAGDAGIHPEHGDAHEAGNGQPEFPALDSEDAAQIGELEQPIADAITTAASALLGSPAAEWGPHTSSATATAPTTPVSCVLEPAASATGVREELLLIGKPWNSPAARLAAPRPTISWFGSTWVRVLAAYVRDSTLVSANETMATAHPPITT